MICWFCKSPEDGALHYVYIYMYYIYVYKYICIYTNIYTEVYNLLATCTYPCAHANMKTVFFFLITVVSKAQKIGDI